MCVCVCVCVCVKEGGGGGGVCVCVVARAARVAECGDCCCAIAGLVVSFSLASFAS